MRVSVCVEINGEEFSYESDDRMNVFSKPYHQAGYALEDAVMKIKRAMGLPKEEL